MDSPEIEGGSPIITPNTVACSPHRTPQSSLRQDFRLLPGQKAIVRKQRNTNYCQKDREIFPLIQSITEEYAGGG